MVYDTGALQRYGPQVWRQLVPSVGSSVFDGGDVERERDPHEVYVRVVAKDREDLTVCLGLFGRDDGLVCPVSNEREYFVVVADDGWLALLLTFTNRCRSTWTCLPGGQNSASQL
jgi:hypothetical protein